MSDSAPGVEVREGDAFAALPELETDNFHAAIIDYPWEYDTENGTDRFGHNQTTGQSDLYDTVEDAQLAFVLEETARIVAPGGWVFIHADDSNYPHFRQMVEDSPLDRKRDVYWDSVTMGMGYYHRVQVYPILTATVGKTKRYVQGRPNIYRAKLHGSSAEYHTMKPVELVRGLLQPPVLEDGERVLAPFAGTFPSGVVAQERGCGALGFEIDDRALSIARGRLEQTALGAFTGGGGGE